MNFLLHSLYRLFARFTLGTFRHLSAAQRASLFGNLSYHANVATETPAGTFRFIGLNPLLEARAREFYTKEPDTSAWIESFPEGAVFWDIGANVGVYTVFAAKARGARTYAFEPSAANYYALCRNIQLNGLDERAKAYCLALCARRQLGVLNLSSPEYGAAINQFGKPGEASPYSDGEPVSGQQGMIGMSVDELVDEMSLPVPNFIKMDVDGLEPDILAGARRTLHDPRLVSVLVELNPGHRPAFDASLALMAAAGFSLVSVGAQQGTSSEVAANHLFRRAPRWSPPVNTPPP